ncbi:Engulfment and cell motility protein 2 [Elsinoe australis]|uniref:Engulfment and cell motility protein 2 n=1 Tax=Elsinoe australis TaxID=40998 RepID=A0A2P7ZD83_9PEZI|nr:Engulfment and cell motility protein 2 [Elsinoe australis]
MDGKMDVATIVNGMNSDSESSRKLAAFHLQSLLADPDFVDAFVQGDGMPALNTMVLRENGNTLAYAMGSLNRILELDFGWEQVGIEVAERAVELVVDRPVINVLRNAFRLLVLIVSRPFDNLDYPLQSPGGNGVGPNIETLKPVLKEHVNFLDALIEKLSSADHALCGNALQFLNALIRDGIMTFSETQLMRFVKRLQDLEIFSTVEGLMRGDSLADIAAPVIDFQTLTKVMLRCWRFVPVDLTRQAHSEALLHIRKTATRALPHKAVPSRKSEKQPETDGEIESEVPWTTIGFETEEPSSDLQETGLLGLMDFADFVRKNNDWFQKTLLEQSVMSPEQRCPIARVSMIVTQMLYEHFNIGDSTASPRASAVMEEQLQGDLDKTVQPLLLCRDRLHGAVAHAFFRIWNTAEATVPEFDKIEQLIRLLITKVIGNSTRTATTQEVEEAIDNTSLAALRKWQLTDLDSFQERAWGTDLSQLRKHLHDESVQFITEQRIRCLLEGSWFPSLASLDSSPRQQPNSRPSSAVLSWRFVQLSPNRRYLHHAAYPRKPEGTPTLADMPQRIDVDHISSVVSNVTAARIPEEVRVHEANGNGNGAASKKSKAEKVEENGEGTVTRLHIHGAARSQADGAESETPLLELQCASQTTASEWLDGLLMLLEQTPITADTTRMIGIVEEWSLKVRLLNLNWEDVDWERADAAAAANGVAGEGKGSGGADGVGKGGRAGAVDADTVPSREGLDDDYWYDMGEG